ncbi:hypothetical protein [Mycoplasma buteonis]|uniref:hypothetical protein n=1 Tax=Mycoplasma buteonis TaxID=171280 RepID=UPI00056B235A|nr:hypothetical protein [Mycoplasma buteonis]
MNKFSKSALYVATGLIATVSLTATIAAFKTKKAFKPSFYNYKSYMSEENQTLLREEFDYKAFDEINQFTNALINRKAAGGIGSDFLAASLIQKNLLKKIDYPVLFNDDDLKKLPKNEQKSLVKKALQTILRKEIWDHLEEYNKFLVDANGKHIKDDDGTDIEFWQYFLPYYSQDSVVAYNVLKHDLADARSVLKVLSAPTKPKTEYSLEDFPEIQEKVQSLLDLDFNSNEYQLANGTESKTDLVNLLKTLSSKGYNGWTITDAIRDNMLFGSSYWKKADGSRTANDFTGEVETKTYRELIDAFVDLIKDGTNYNVTDNQHISFKGDGLELLNNLINLTRPDVKAAIMYNGDAIDAYYGAYNLPGWSIDGSIRAVKPRHNLLLVDGLVFSANNTDKKNDDYLTLLGKSIYQNLQSEYQVFKTTLFNQPNNEFSATVRRNFIEQNVANYWTDIKENEILTFLEENEYSKEESKNLAKEYVEHYLPYFSLLNTNNSEFLTNHYSKDTDEVNPNLASVKFNLSKYESDFLTNLWAKIKSNQLDETDFAFSYQNILAKQVQAFLSDNADYFEEELDLQNFDKLLDLVAEIISYLDLSNDYVIEKYLNLNNFDYINYDPTQNIDYELVLRNYFATVGYGIDQLAVEMYKIENTENIVHKAITPVDDQLQSLITTYYFNRTKS